MCFLNQSNEMKTFQMDNSKKLWGHEIGDMYRFVLKSVHVPNLTCKTNRYMSPISAKG